MGESLAVQAQSQRNTLLLALIRLTKPGVTAVLVFTATMTAWAAGGPWVTGLQLLWLALAGGLMAAGAAALNQYLEQDIDARMPRTAQRPLPAGIAHPMTALVWGALLCLSGLGIALAVLPAQATLFIALGLIVYIPVYTLFLKPRTTLNIVLGGAAGCFPVLAGWAAVRADWPPVPFALAALIFFWTPAHFWAYAMVHKEGYRQAGIPMLPARIGLRATVPHIAIHSILMVLSSCFAFHGIALVIALFSGAAMLALVAGLWLDPIPRRAYRLYRFSNLYLIIVFLGMVLGQ